MSSNLNVGITIGVISVSSAAIFIRLADAPPLVIASYRMAIGASVMLGIAMGSWYRHGTNYLSHITKRDMPIVVVSAICLSMHFWAWILSLEYTSVASSVVLVTTSPFILSIASKGLFKEPIHKYTVIGIGINVKPDNANFPELMPTATYLDAKMIDPISRQVLLRHILQEGDILYRELQQGSTPLDEWRSLLDTLGKIVTVRVKHGGPGSTMEERTYSGLAEGVDAAGNLLIRTKAGRRIALSAGEVTLQEAVC